jgi:hypothetical protein
MEAMLIQQAGRLDGHAKKKAGHLYRQKKSDHGLTALLYVFPAGSFMETGHGFYFMEMS